LLFLSLATVKSPLRVTQRQKTPEFCKFNCIFDYLIGFKWIADLRVVLLIFALLYAFSNAANCKSAA
jgi:hypothetical protein